ncbi:putative ketoamine kinase [Methylorubrum aminovorans]|uniref:Ketoamine kinase n=1 Tax=Methylorubrum aminovorans TaxID=269069 RepID=A0ABQ4UFH3_9HYPH|nr:fructosamine kinase family protein [Methylorubrum aminovorans]GJE65867.1 putative ketoamine kinase [Methylorubrum aminovorans]GMA75776.1 aminoglycoside phosphotransferase [Methylorubrum aminovorans]
MNALARRAAELLGVPVAEARPMAGGDLSPCLRLRLADGRDVVAKSGPAPREEARMLAAIAASGAPAPAVLAADETVLVLECLPATGTGQQAEADLGRVVARLHVTEGPRYGWHADYAFGSVAIENGWGDDWPAFWRERRLLCHAGHLPASLFRRVERLADDLTNRLPERPRAALLHGDLWGGNVLYAGERVSGLIDPACYHGHAEVDLAMLSLFGRPGPAFHAAYGTLEPGAAERAPIYKLWPALVHRRLFGAGYDGMVEGVLEAAGV